MQSDTKTIVATSNKGTGKVVRIHETWYKIKAAGDGSEGVTTGDDAAGQSSDGEKKASTTVKQEAGDAEKEAGDAEKEPGDAKKELGDAKAPPCCCVIRRATHITTRSPMIV